MDEKKPAAPQAASTSTTDSNATLFSVLAYINILWLVPFLAAKDSKLAQYHANQGCVLFLFEVGLWLAWFVLIFIPVLGWLIGLAGSITAFVFAIIGIINASKGEMKPLPVIGGITILK